MSAGCKWHIARQGKINIDFTFHLIACLSRSPIHLLHSINQYCLMKKRDLLSMNEMDLKFNKVGSIFLAVDNFLNPTMLCDSLDVDLQNALNSMPWNTD